MIDKILSALEKFDEWMGEINAENSLWFLASSLGLGLFFGCTAIPALIKVGVPPIYLIKMAGWFSFAGLLITIPCSLFYTKKWWRSIVSGAAIGFGFFAGTSTPILLYWAHSELNGKIEFVALVAVLLIISGIFDYRNDRLDQMKTKDWHSVGPPPV